MSELITIGLLFLIGIAGILVSVAFPSAVLALSTFSFVLKGGQTRADYTDLTALLLLATAMSVTLIFLVKRKALHRPKSTDYAVLAFILVIGLGILYAESEQRAVIKVARFIALVGVPYFLARIILTNTTRLQIFFDTIVVAALAVSAVIVISVSFPSIAPDFMRSSAETGGRVTIAEANPVALSTFLMVGALVLFTTRGTRGRVLRLVTYPALALILYTMLLSGTRGPVIALIASIAVYGTSLLMRRPSKIIAIAMPSILVLAVSIAVFPFEKLPNWYRFSQLRDIRTNPDPSIAEREVYVVEPVALFQGSPVIGAGTAATNPYPHNIFLEVAAENGLVGLIALGALLIIIVRRTIQYIFVSTAITSREKSMILGTLLPAIALLVEKQFSFGLDGHRDLFVFLAATVNLPMILASISGKQIHD